MRKRIYLDYAASAPIDAKVRTAMLPYLKKEYGNPSSLHSFGQRTRAALELAREKAAKFLNCAPLEVIFTSGASEANNLAIQGVVRASRFTLHVPKLHIITSQIEHESVLEPCRMLEKQGIAEVTYVPVTREGIVRVEDIEKAIKENTALASIMYANSEIGAIQPIAEIGMLLKKYKIPDTRYKILFHTDAVQAANYLDCDVQKLGVDLLTLSAHKIYGPKGAGLLHVRKGVALDPFIMGGGQEFGVRSGTENVAGIVGFGVALEQLQDPRQPINNIKIRQLRDKLIKAILKRIPDSTSNGSFGKCLSNNAHVRFGGVEGKDVVIMLDQQGIAISTGSACSERTQEPSHVLLALGLSPQEALSGIRITLGKYTTQEEIERTVKILTATVAKLRKTGVK